MNLESVLQPLHIPDVFSTSSQLVETNISIYYTVYNGTDIEHSYRNNVANSAVRPISLEHFTVSHASRFFILSFESTQLSLGMYRILFMFTSLRLEMGKNLYGHLIERQ